MSPSHVQPSSKPLASTLCRPYTRECSDTSDGVSWREVGMLSPLSAAASASVGLSSGSAANDIGAGAGAASAGALEAAAEMSTIL